MNSDLIVSSFCLNAYTRDGIFFPTAMLNKQ